MERRSLRGLRRPGHSPRQGRRPRVRHGAFRPGTLVEQAERTDGSTMNARSETAAEKPAFKAPFARRQWCVVPAWEVFEPFYAPSAKRSERWGVQRADGTALSIAGLWVLAAAVGS